MIAKHSILGLAIALVPAAVAAASLPGVSDEETTIRSGAIREMHAGKGDVLFVRDRENKWYRMALNEGCIADLGSVPNATFISRDISGEIDLLATVVIENGGQRRCAINSIRRSVAPPQVDSKSPVTLD